MEDIGAQAVNGGPRRPGLGPGAKLSTALARLVRNLGLRAARARWQTEGVGLRRRCGRQGAGGRAEGWRDGGSLGRRGRGVSCK